MSDRHIDSLGGVPQVSERPWHPRGRAVFQLRIALA
ncbi:hypothetical protein SUDANB51_07003 [Streptomyces sp. enrichment culture]